MNPTASPHSYATVDVLTLEPEASTRNPFLGWPEAMLIERMDALGAAADARRPVGLSSLSSLGGASIDYMTSEERMQLHLLKMALPTFAQMRLDAAERIKARIQARRRPGLR